MMTAAQMRARTAKLELGRYHALIIGNDKYRHLPMLRTAVRDARAVGKLLKTSYGFSVKLLLNATRGQILRALSAYRRTLTPRDNLLIYYAGHGWLDKDADAGYWLPVDADKKDPVNWVANSAITGALKAMQARHVLVVADSCFSGKLVRGVGIQHRTPDYLKRIAAKRARLVMASGGLEPVADGGGRGGHSIFASAFLAALRNNRGMLEGTALFNKIRRPVVVNSDQTPEYADIRKAGHDGGDFIFARKRK